jgi:glyoxylase-like metal-dependent hydrolase (beta-lactamase superfamily II)/rhodanese-related sulfurtransferase
MTGRALAQNRSQGLTIEIDELRTMLEGDQPLTILDVRSSEDRAEWAIPGSLHVNAYDALKAGDPDALRGMELPADGTVVTVCGAGKVSQTAAEQLRARGIDAVSLAGGMKAWSRAWNTANISVPGSQATVIQVRRVGKGCLSYLVGSGSEAAVVDAALDPVIYRELAQQNGWHVTHVLDTHIHADHLSRSRLLADQTGAALHLPAQHRASFPFAALHDGDSIAIGESYLVALATPGHTMEAMTYHLDDRALFTGDTLFLTGVGRPDLEASGEEMLVRARLLYRSLQRLSTLPGNSLVLPGHTIDPIAFDDEPIGRSLADVLGQVEILNLPEDEFLLAITSRVPAAPPNHAQILWHNESGLLPIGDPAELEAGANRCAVT